MPTKKLRTEHEEQTILIAWALLSEQLQTDPIKRLALRWLHAVPLGYHKSPASRMKAQREGVKSGVLDLCIPSPELKEGVRKSGTYHGLYIEMKRKGEKLRDTQSSFMDYLDLVHYRSALCFTWEDAARIVVEHLDLEHYEIIPETTEDDSEIVKDILAKAKVISDRLRPPKEMKTSTRKARPRKSK